MSLSLTVAAALIAATWIGAAIILRPLLGSDQCPLCQGPHELSKCPHWRSRI